MLLPMHKELAVPQPDPVVVIDDDDAVRNSLQFSLEVEGYAVRAYEGAGKLLQEADLPRCGCLIIDYNLPDTDGLTALGKLRDRGVRAPAILITTNPSPALRARAAAANVPIVEKPLLGNTLLEAVHEAIAGSAGASRA
jgi:two-component system response regulator FixJ